MESAKLSTHSEIIEELAHAIAFDSERHLIDIVIDQIHRFIENAYVSTELPIGAGIVDVVAGQIESAYKKFQPFQAVTETEAYILSHLYYKQRLKAATVARRAKLPLSTVHTTLGTLQERGYCLMSGECYLRSKPFVNNLIAIEGKIKNWRRALQQAIRNQLFSSRSFVAIDARYSRPAMKNVLLFRKHRIGLAIVSSNGAIEIVYNPPRSRPIAPVMPIIAESALLQRMKSLEC